PALRTALVDSAKNNPTNGGNFVTAAEAALAAHGAALSAAEQTTVEDAMIDHWRAVRAYMLDPANGMDTASNYRDTVKDNSMSVVGAAFEPDVDAGSGCTIFHCDKLISIGSDLLGWAFNVTGGAGNRCGFLLCATQADHSAGDSIENTATHEYGHHFFLPHTPDAGEKKNYKAHDSSITTCIMSYNVPTEFCGFCQLRLRGWSKDALKPKSDKNTKT
ncbi:MAG: hypothetical protein ACRD5L_01035, partial [Bryobacteraceae bacterium]